MKDMPLTPLHYSVAYLTHKMGDRLSFPALIVGSFVPDLETLALYVATGCLHRGVVLHSLFGAVTLGLFLAVLLTLYVYPPVVSFIFRLDRKVVEERCRFSGWLVFSCLITIVAHVLLDSLHHEFNPLLFPFFSRSFDALVLFGNWIYASIVIQSVFLVLSTLILISEMRKGKGGFWKRTLVG